MAQTLGLTQDASALLCDSIRWECANPAAAVLPVSLRSASSSGRFFNRGQRSWDLVGNNQPAGQNAWASASPVEAIAVPGTAALTADFSLGAKNHYDS